MEKKQVKKIPLRFTMGILFNYVINSTRDKYNTYLPNGISKKNTIKEADVMQALIQISNPSHPKAANSTMTTNTSQFKKCEINGSDWIPFDKELYIDEFNEEFKNNYISLLTRTNMFFINYIEIISRFKSLTRALLTFLTCDKSLNQEDEVYILNNKQSIKIKDINPEYKYEADVVFLGIIHYLLNKKIDNKTGKETLSGLYNESAKHTKKSFKGFYTKPFENTPIILRSITDEKYNPLAESKQSYENKPNIQYGTYLTKAKDKYKTLKTLLYTDSPRNFYDFYVCNNLSLERGIQSFHFGLFFDFGDEYGIKNATVQKLISNVSNFLIISGTGGLGKSMMMRHLLLSSIDAYDKTNILPIFIPLKEYNNKYDNLVDFAYDKLSALCDIKKDDFIESVVDGNVIFLFDGLDEINSEYLASFQKQIEIMTDKYSANVYIISTRPSDEFINYTRFSVLQLLPFSRNQAIELIQKLDFRPDMPEIKEKFLKKLKDDLFDSHTEFTKNPLLLTIMLMTFENYGDVPSKMHKFYSEAYETLARKHDASKGAYKRQMKTKLSTDMFREYLEEFSMITYYDEQFEFTKEQFESYFKKLKIRNKYPNFIFGPSEFLYDLVNCVCLLYKEGGKYHFVHRSFQEYFCASFFAKQKDKVLEKIGDFFANKKQRVTGDKTFDMLIDMIPEKSEEYIFLPFLNKNFKPILESNDPYIEFIKTFYPTISYSAGDTPYKMSTQTNSVILKKILSFLQIYLITLSLPHEDDFVTEWYVTVYDAADEKHERPEIIRLRELTGNDEDGNPIDLDGADGWEERFKVEELIRNKELYLETYNALQTCGLKDVFNKIKDYYDLLLRKTSDEDKDDLLSYFE